MALEEHWRQYRARFARRWKRLNKKRVFAALAVLVLIISGLAALLTRNFGARNLASAAFQEAPLGSFPLVVPTLKYGFVLDTFQVAEAEVQKNQSLSDILVAYGVGSAGVAELVSASQGVFDVTLLRPGRPFMALRERGSGRLAHFVYEPSKFYYVVYDFLPSGQVRARRVEREVQLQERAAAGVINSSLWNAMTDNGMDYALAAKMEEALAWSVDFYHIQKDDRFKLVFEEMYIDGERVGIGRLKAAYFQHRGEDYYAFLFKNERHEGYYDLEARPMKKAFLKSPVDYARISSHFNLKRFHPVLKRVRPHLGTDYAAPYGTPIRAVADGQVLEAQRKGGNGNYVKIKHDQVYTTQYLHMQKFAEGIRPGTRVRQGQVIGYVGSTGLATGPHVCFRFWKNGQQVNHLEEKLPPPEPLPAEDLAEFNTLRDSLKLALDALAFAPGAVPAAEAQAALDSLGSNP